MLSTLLRTMAVGPVRVGGGRLPQLRMDVWRSKHTDPPTPNIKSGNNNNSNNPKNNNNNNFSAYERANEKALKKKQKWEQRKQERAEKREEKREEVEAKRKSTIISLIVARLRPNWDLNEYKEFFPIAREMKRRHIFFVGPTNSGKSFRAFNALLDPSSVDSLFPSSQQQQQKQQEKVNAATATETETETEKEKPMIDEKTGEFNPDKFGLAAAATDPEDDDNDDDDDDDYDSDDEEQQQQQQQQQQHPRQMKGVYLSPLRLLALEGQEEIERRGAACSLRTGDETEDKPGAQFLASTIESASTDRPADAVMIDEIHMILDDTRGWAWSQALIGYPAKTVVMTGSPHCLPTVERLIKEYLHEELVVVHLDRLGPLHLLPRVVSDVSAVEKGTAIILFSRRDVLSLKTELEKRGRTCSVLYGNLSPPVRRAESARFRSGATDILVATDCIGMGLNLPIKTVVFWKVHKFDGKQLRLLTRQETKQIAGRAGRFGQYPVGYVGAASAEGQRVVRENLRTDSSGSGRKRDKTAIQQHNHHLRMAKKGGESEDDDGDHLRLCNVRPSLNQLTVLAMELGSDNLLSVLSLFEQLSTHSNNNNQQQQQQQQPIDNELAERFAFLFAPLQSAAPPLLPSSSAYLRSGDLQEVMAFADMIESDEVLRAMPLADKYDFAIAPVSPNDDAVMQTYKQWLHVYAAKAQVPLHQHLFDRLVPPPELTNNKAVTNNNNNENNNVAISSSDISKKLMFYDDKRMLQAETALKLMTLYTWLHRRWPETFPDETTAVQLKETANGFLETALKMRTEMHLTRYQRIQSDKQRSAERSRRREEHGRFVNLKEQRKHLPPQNKP